MLPQEKWLKMMGSGSYLTTETKTQPLMVLYYIVTVAIINDIHYSQILGLCPPFRILGGSSPLSPPSYTYASYTYYVYVNSPIIYLDLPLCRRYIATVRVTGSTQNIVVTCS